MNATASRNPAEPAVQAIMMAIRRAVDSGEITASTETQLQNSLHLLRSTAPYSEAISSLEKAAANLRMIAEAKRAGRCNLYMSKLIRLRKELLA
jgi:hypothetical protein